ncbi:MAG: alpha/beta fold hydrolase [Gammaproteobacteria bacterium]|nr:alpha/beta fold hydrolase [Gammaproteobacteria bacterium]
MPRITANGIELYYEVEGRGPRLLFISGTGGDLRTRPNVFDSPLAGHFEILAFDQRGLGQSAVPAGPYTMADYGADAGGLLEALGWGAVPVVGVSFGGMVAQELALQFPERVSALVLCCTSAGGAGGASYPLHELAGLPQETRLVRQLELADLRRDDAWREKNPEQWQRLLDFARSAQRNDRDESGAALQLAARAGHDTWPRLPALDMPVLIAGGRHDGIAPVANLEALAERIPGAELALFDGGHLFMIQDKRAYPAMVEWIRRRIG